MLPARSDSDVSRLSAALDGDADAWSALIDEHGPRIWSVCRRLAREPEDAYQEVWERIQRTLPRFDPARGTLRAWMTAITHRHLIDRHRRRQVRGEVLRLDDRASVLPMVDEQIDRSRRKARLDEAIARLPDAQRRVVVLHHLGGRSLADIADEEGVAIGTIKSRLHRGRARLAELLAPVEEP